MPPSDKPWIDVLTQSIARGLTRPCIESLLAACEDRQDFRLRWVCHLDAHPKLADLYGQEVSQIRLVAREFDDSVIILSSTHKGFGPSLYRLLQFCENDALWTCDDWSWAGKTFSLQKVREATEDAYCFVTPKTNVGALSPSFYRHHVFDLLRECLRDRGHLESVSENTCFGFLKTGYRMTGTYLLHPVDNHPGLARMKELGFTHNIFGQPIGTDRKRARWSDRQQRFLER